MAKSRRTRSVLSEHDRERLEKIKTDPHSILKHVQRAAIILYLGNGLTLTQTMRATGMSKPTVWRWWDRFLAEGVDGLLYDIPRRRGRKPVSEDKVSELIALAMSPPPEHASHWTLRVLAKKVGIAVSTVFGILQSRPQAPQGQDIQGLPRPEVRAEGPRRRRPLRQPARPRRGHLGGREDADPGVGTDAGAPADEARPSRDPHP